MSPEVRGFIALVVACLVAFPTYRWARHKKSRKRIFMEKAQKSGHCVIGTYESSKLYPGIRDSENPQLREDTLEVKYKYTVDGSDYYKRMKFQSRGRIGTDFPDEVKVYYHQANPQKAVCPEEVPPSQQIQTGCLTTIALTFLSMIATLTVLEILF